MGDVLLIRDARADDLPHLCAIERASNASPWSDAQLAAELGRAGTTLRVAERAGVPVGFLCAWHVGDELHVLEVAVDPSHRRSGHGRALLRDAEARARSAGLRSSLLEVRAYNVAAIALYRSEGYVEVGRRPRYYRDDGADAVLMTHEFGSEPAP